MRFLVAAFGDTGKRHGILGCPGEARAFFQEIANRTDRPGYTPIGVSWPPYLSGFAYKDYYLLMRTLPDDSASRPGMVYTVAVAGELDSFSKINNLQPLIDLLPKTLEKRIGPSGTVIEIEDERLRFCASAGLPSRLASSLVSSSEIVVWGDPGSFDDIIRTLWCSVWPSIRKRLSFRLSFDPSDIDRDHPPTLVTALPQVRSRWSRDQFIEPSEPSEAAIVGAASLLTQGESRNGILQLVEALDAMESISDLRQLSLVDALLNASQQNSQTFSSLRSQLQLAAKLTPGSDKGSRFKAPVLAELQRRIPEQTVAAEIRGLRNVPTDSFDSSSVEQILAQVTKWIEQHAVENTAAGDSVSILLKDGFDDQTSWGKAVRTGLANALKDATNDSAKAVWLWVSGELMPYADQIVELFTNSARNELSLADTCPDLSKQGNLAQHLARLSKKRALWELHAELAFRSGSKRAVADHVAVLPVGTDAGVERLRRRIGSEFVGQAITVGDSRLLDAARRQIAESPEMWNEFDSGSLFWRQLFVRTIDSGSSGTWTVDSKHDLTRKVIQFLLRGEARDGDTDNLWTTIAKFQPDWSDFVEEITEEGWNAIPSTHRTTIMDATAAGILSKFANAGISVLPSVPVLRVRIVADVQVRTALYGISDVSLAVALFEQLPEIPQHLFVWWMGNRMTQSVAISGVTAIRIGELIEARKWRDAASKLSQLAEYRSDLNGAIERCIGLIGMLRRVQMFFGGRNIHPHQIDVWAALEELGLELYPYGPGVKEVWKRAGGHTADIPRFNSGREAWSTVISQARAGGHDVTPRSLTNAMLEDYPRNPNLTHIERLIDEAKV
jgi:hypothetical protein